MNCSLNLQKYASDCVPNIGGVRAIWAASRADVVVRGSDFAPGSNYIEFVRASGVSEDITPFSLVARRPALSSFTVSPQYNEDAGTLYFHAEIGVVLNRMTSPKSANVWQLAAKNPLIIVEDMNGIFWLFGISALPGGTHEDEVRLTGGSYGSGVQKADRNGYDLVLSCDVPTPPAEFRDDQNSLLETL